MQSHAFFDQCESLKLPKTQLTRCQNLYILLSAIFPKSSQTFDKTVQANNFTHQVPRQHCWKDTPQLSHAILHPRHRNFQPRSPPWCFQEVGVEESLATAIGDLPKPGMFGSFSHFHYLESILTWFRCYAEEHGSNMGMRSPMRAGVCFCNSDKVKIGNSNPSSHVSFNQSTLLMSRRPDIVAKLQVGLYTAMPDTNTIPNIAVLQKLPYFNAITKEADGIAPELNSKCMVQFPHSHPKTAWSMHRDPAVFSSLLTFLRDGGATRADADAFHALRHRRGQVEKSMEPRDGFL
ncbi:hypothetical protein FIBSPDRAFT_882899 [Athelia psychrophila]|uniref:Uncharacterized protein n=1 Tax=Athelia psychrophila TaxID=1759441 RepID=A0A166UUI4_9AGAM|nr:hypothetical protein FIBSPDRAFT_882899 [Fibularhizoctonia sp. CBS 109695]